MEADIKEAIEQLPSQCRKIFCLSRYEFKSNDEIAEALNISVNTVRTQISRALDNLRFKLKKYL
jgi:RNA polymerase sigma-70 factor, ECF subfamily